MRFGRKGARPKYLAFNEHHNKYMQTALLYSPFLFLTGKFISASVIQKYLISAMSFRHVFS